MSNGTETVDKVGLACERKVDGALLTIVVKEDVENGASFSREVDLSAIFGEAFSSLSDVGQNAAIMGVWTPLRNSTAGQSLATAESRMDARLDAWAEGIWTERGKGEAGIKTTGLPFSAGSDWVAALCAVYPEHFADKAAAVGYLNGQVDADAWKGFDDEQKGEARKLIRERLRQDRKLVEAQKALADARKAKKIASGVDKPLFS